MAGVSHRHVGAVPGADGFGKVNIVFKPKPPRRGHRKLGVLVYGTMFFFMGLSFAWSREHLRYAYVIPAMRTILSLVDRVKGGSVEPASIVTPSLHKALFDQGAAHATDRLMQMEIYRRTAFGTLSEYYGNTTVESDKLYRTLQLHQLAEEDFQNLPDGDRQALDAYVNGVNSRLTIAAQDGTLPIDLQLLFGRSLDSSVLQPWRAVDTLAVLRLLAYTWSYGWEGQLSEFLIARGVHMDAGDLWIRHAGEAAGFVAGQGAVHLPSAGGTAVAISAARSSTGSALLASSITSPASHQGLWYMSSLRVPGLLEVSGASVPGIPYVFVGRNKQLSWSFTQSTRHVEELFVDAAPVGEDTTDATPAALIQREETLKVRGEADVSFLVDSSAVGPVISKHLAPVLIGNIEAANFDWRKLALKSDSLRQRMTLSFLQGINIAQNVTAFTAAVEKLTAVSLDFVFASTDGRVGAVGSGRRASDVSVEGEGEALAGWRKLTPDAIENTPVPDSIESTDGVIVAAESAATAQRIHDLLGKKESRVAPNSLKELLADTYSPTSQTLVEIILNLPVTPEAESSTAADDIRAAQAIVRGFAGRYTVSASPAVLLEAFRLVLVQNVLKPLNALSNVAAGAPVSAAHRLSTVSLRSEVEWVVKHLLRSEDAPESASWWRAKLRDPTALVTASLQEALEWCRSSFGKDPKSWKWGAAHSAQYAHPNPKWFTIIDEVLTRGPAPMSGAVDSVARSGYHSYAGLLTTSALRTSADAPVSSLRMVVDMADASSCLWSQLPHGASNRLGSAQGPSTAVLARWSTEADVVSAYEQMCAVQAPTEAKKDEL